MLGRKEEEGGVLRALVDAGTTGYVHLKGEKGGDGCGLYCRGGVCTSSLWMLGSFIVFAFFSSKRLFLCEIF